jgi:hypothetical protein
VASIQASGQAANQKNEGNWIGMTSSYTTTGGETRSVVDVWFVADRNGTMASSTSALAQEIAGFAAQDPGGATPSLPVGDVGGGGSTPYTLAAQVADLAREIASFNATRPQDAAATEPHKLRAPPLPAGWLADPKA